MIPPTVAEVLDPIKVDFLWLSETWKFSLKLFGTDERVELLNRSSSGAFVAFQGALRDSVFLGIGRMTDPAETGGKKNLSLARLGVEVSATSPPALADTVAAEVAKAEAISAPFREWRNRWIAHADLRTKLKVHPTPLPGIPPSAVNDVLACVAAALKAIHEHYDGTPTLYEYETDFGSADLLIEALKRAETHRDCERRDFEHKYGVKLEE